MANLVTVETLKKQVHENVSSTSMNDTQTKAFLNQAVADLSKAYAMVYQVHWYMRGQGFYYLHPKMDEFLEGLTATRDELSERLIAIGGAPYSTLKEFDVASNLEDEVGSFDKSMQERLQDLVNIYRYLSNLYQAGLEVTDSEGDVSTNDLLTSAKTDADKTVWMLSAELGKGPKE